LKARARADDPDAGVGEECDRRANLSAELLIEPLLSSTTRILLPRTDTPLTAWAASKTPIEFTIDMAIPIARSVPSNRPKSMKFDAVRNKR